MVVYVRSKDELENLIRSSRIVLVVYVDRSEESRSLGYAAKMFERLREPIITVAVIDVVEVLDKRLLAEIKDVPQVKLYVNGEIVFEQKGGMGYYQKDFIVLKEGIKSVLTGRGIRFLL